MKLDKKIKFKKITIDNLAIMIKESFDGVDKRFDGINKRFDGVDKCLDDLEKGQEDIKLRLGNVAYRFELLELERRVKKLEMKLNLRNL